MAMAMAMATLAGVRCLNARRGIELMMPARSRPFASAIFCPPRALHDLTNKGEDEEESSPVLIASLSSQYNDIMVVDTPNSRLLLLDSTLNVHSMLNKEQKWTGAYWDQFASLPAIVPQGRIAILGLGGGTAAHLMLELWPSLQIEGWEIDEILIDMAREYFGMSNLEKCTKAGGSLSVHIGDALSSSSETRGAFAGIIVDLFSGGKILPQLHEEATWLELEKKLIPHGRIMVNCGGAHSENNDKTLNSSVPLNGSWVKNSVIKTMCRAFPRKLSWMRIKNKDGDNYLALTGPPPNTDAWAASLPSPLSFNVEQWKPCELS